MVCHEKWAKPESPFYTQPDIYQADPTAHLLAPIRATVSLDTEWNRIREALALSISKVETDEIYVGVDKGGSHYVVPVQAKGGNDSLNRVQIEQDIALCADKLSSLICRPVGTQLMQDDLIALFEFEQEGEDVKVVSEKHYQLVPPDAVSLEDLERYRQRLSDGM